MGLKSQPMQLKVLKAWARSAADAIDVAPSGTQWSLGFTIQLNGFIQKNSEEAKTILRKFEQALGYFPDDHLALPQLTCEPINEVASKYDEEVAKSFEAKMSLLKGAEEVSSAKIEELKKTAKKVGAVSELKAKKKAAGSRKSQSSQAIH